MHQLNIWFKKSSADPIHSVTEHLLWTKRSNYRYKWETLAIVPSPWDSRDSPWFLTSQLTSLRWQAYRPVFALAAAWIGADRRAQWIERKQLCMHGTELRELSFRLSGAETQQIELARPTTTFFDWSGLQSWKVSFAPLFHASDSFSLSLLSALTLMNSSAFLHPQIIFHERNIHWLMPTALRPFLVIMALRLGRGHWYP